TFRFTLGRTPLSAGVGDPTQSRAMPLKPEKARFVTQTGVQLREPCLTFARKGAEGGWAHDIHPVRGILENRPYDFSLTRHGLADRVSVGVVCPAAEAANFEGFLRGLLNT